MRKIIILISLALIVSNCYSQDFYVFKPNYGLENILFDKRIKYKFVKKYGERDIGCGERKMENYIQKGKDYTFLNSGLYFASRRFQWYQQYKINLIITSTIQRKV